MSRHEGVSCDNCLKTNFKGKRFKCLICYDYDLCENCHSVGVTTTRHLASHAMQCILTRSEFDLYYGGETISPESPPSFVCPFCASRGFTENLLREHVTKDHANQRTEVVCPVCAAQPSGEPNLVTEDLAHHLSVEHRGTRDFDDSFSGRHIRRMFYPGRGMRTRNHRSMHFTGGPLGSSSTPSSAVVANNNTSSSTARESIDPIAELLSQLGGVRRSAQQLQQSATTASQLQELQSQLQLERQRAAEIRQQLERFPSKLSSNTSQNVHPSGGVTLTSKAANNSKKSPSALQEEEDDDLRFLLTNFDAIDVSENEEEKLEDLKRSLFTQELILSMLASNCDKFTPEKDDKNLHKAGTRGAVTALTPTSIAQPSSSNDLKSKSQNSQNSSKLTFCGVQDSLSSSNCESQDTFKSPLAANPSVDASLSACDQDDSGRFGDSPAISSRSAPTLGPGAGEQCPPRETDGQWPLQSTTDDDDKTEAGCDNDAPPSPTFRFQGRALFSPGSVPVPGGVPNAASIAEYRREDVPTGSINKNIH